MADRELLRRFSAEGDEAAFAEIVRRHGRMLLRVCQRALPNGHDAEDVCQAAFLLLAQKAATVRWDDSVAGWLFQTAYRLCLKARRAAGRRAHHEARARPAGQADPVAELSARELQAILDEELSRLPEQFRAPIVLCCLEGRSRDEAASCLGWPLATVKDRLERGRERLRARLAQRGVLLGTALTSAWLVEGGAQAGLSAEATARAAVLVATGQATLAGLLPPWVAALAKGGMTTMLLCRVTLLGAGIALGLGSVVGVSKPPAAAPPTTQQARPAPAETDLVQPQVLRLVGHKGAVNAIAFAPGGKAVATAGADRTVRVWDPATGVQLYELLQPDIAVAVAFSPDGKSLAAASAGKVGELILWDADTRKERWRGTQKLASRGVTGHLAGTRGAVAFSADGKKVAAGSGANGVAFAVLDVPTGKMLFASWKNQMAETAVVAFSPDGKWLVDGNRDVVTLSVASGKEVRSWRVKGTVTALAFLGDGTKLAVADGGKAVRILNILTGKQEEAFAGQQALRSLALSGDRKRLATAAADGTLLLWDTAGKQERRFSAGGPVNALAFSPDGNRLAMAGPDGAVIWDLMRDEKPLPKDFKLTDKEIDRLWAELASDEGGKVYAAARLLRADPARSVPFLQQRLKPKTASPTPQRLEQLIANLDADDFKTRETATQELENLGQPAAAALREALAARPSLEVRRRLEQLLQRLGGQGQALTAEQQRDVRAVRVLEQAGTLQAKKLLEVLGKESPGWWVQQEAKAALDRLARRGVKP